MQEMYAATNSLLGVGLGATTQEPEESLPTRAEVKEGYQYYLDLAPQKFPSKDMSPQEAVEWGRAALNNYAERKGITRNAHFQASRDYVASSNSGKGFNPNNQQYAQYAHALGEITGAASSEYYGVAVQLGVVTYDTLKDGGLDESDAEKIGQVTGAVVGGIVGQAFGVPAPIGALVGGYLGGGSARIIYHAFAGEDLHAKTRRLAAEAREKMTAYRDNAVWVCKSLESAYWRGVEDFYRKLAESWTTAEQNVQWRFALRWFDPNPGLAFRYTWNRTSRMPTDSSRSDTYGLEYNCGTRVVHHSAGVNRVRSCLYRCPHVYGCPYPSLGRGAVPSQVVEAALTDDHERVSQALAARGVIWLPKNQRLNCEAYIPPVPGGNLSADYQRRMQYMSNVSNRLRQIHSNIATFTRARSFLQADLLRTLTVVRTERDMYMRRAQYLTDGWQKGSYDKAIQNSKTLSSLLNNAVLVGGGALAGYGLWRALK